MYGISISPPRYQNYLSWKHSQILNGRQRIVARTASLILLLYQHGTGNVIYRRLITKKQVSSDATYQYTSNKPTPIKRYLNKRATKSISCSSFSIPVLLIIRSSIISLNFQFSISIFNYLSMFTNRPAIDTRIESELTQRVVLLPISEFLAFVLFGVT